MGDWRANPVLMQQLLDYTAQHNPALRRRMAILDVLAWRGFSTWDVIVAEVENVLGAGVFGRSPQARVWSDIRALREAGIALGYSRRKGLKPFENDTPGTAARRDTALRRGDSR